MNDVIHTERNVPVLSLFGIRRESATGFIPGIEEVTAFIKQSEQCGFSGCLLPESNNGPLHSWVFAQLLYSATEQMIPFIAINPVYLHPFYAAKQIANFIVFYKRRLFLNYITGTAKTDAHSLNDHLDSAGKYRRLTEFITIVNGLLYHADQPFSFSGEFYEIRDLRLPFPVHRELLPWNFIAGSSPNALNAIENTGSARLCMGMPLEELDDLNKERNYNIGIHIGIIARETKEQALEALAAFSSGSREKQLLQHIATQNAGAAWKKELLEKARTMNERDTYSLVAFRNFDSDVPYLVGSYEEVAAYVQDYMSRQVNLVVIEIPVTGHDEFSHLKRMWSVFARS